mmetsp:Transcript_11398/g.14836  ORF Transcript_11398/g.14836 Transcript_11398/m.14836 type:complete len:284 (-) Transcript_11398:237-1088(-)
MGKKDGISPKLMNFTVMAWGSFLSVSLLCYYLFSDGDFSFVMTYASMTRFFAFAVLVFKMVWSKSSQGVSLKTLELYLLMYVFRLAAIARHEGYLPFDRSGDWFYHIVEFCSLCLVGVASFLVMGPFSARYEKAFDCFGNLHVPPAYGAIYLIVPCLFLALIFHPSLNNEWFSDCCWTFSMYLETVAIMPQLYMFQKQVSRVVEVLISHSVFALGFARVLDLVFWLSTYGELAGKAQTNFSGILILITQFINVALMGDFFYYYFLSIKSGTGMQLPMTSATNV